MTDFLSKISQRVRDNAKAWHEAAGLPDGVAPADEKGLASKAAEEKSFENLKILAGLYAEGVPPREVSALNLVMAANPKTSISGLIKVARDKRSDPALAPWLKLLKERLLPPRETTKKDGEYDAEKEKALEAAEKQHRIEGSKLLYESTAIAHTLLVHIGVRKPGADGKIPTADLSELQSATERYEQALGRKLNEDEKFA